MVVLAKQVPDTKRITGQAMKEDGTVNRSALPAIFNPEDLNALEAALDIKERFGGHVTVIIMGPPSAAEQLREALYRGADNVVLLTDRRFAVADTLATSYTLAMAIGKLGGADIVLCGRQAIDGDTAQVGPQTAEKLGWPQIAYVQEIQDIKAGRIRARRMIEGGYEVIECPLPVLMTITDECNEPRPYKAKALLQYRHAGSASDIAGRMRKAVEEKGGTADMNAIVPEAKTKADELAKRGLRITEWNLDDLGADPERCGAKGSPTKVKKIESVVLKTSELKMIDATEEGIRALVKDLATKHILD
jgi:electron transfer flavoprotein beta subunit